MQNLKGKNLLKRADDIQELSDDELEMISAAGLYEEHYKDDKDDKDDNK